MTTTNIVDLIENRYDFPLSSIEISGNERNLLLQFFEFFSQIVMEVTLPLFFKTGTVRDSEFLMILIGKCQNISDILREKLIPDLDD